MDITALIALTSNLSHGEARPEFTGSPAVLLNAFLCIYIYNYSIVLQYFLSTLRRPSESGSLLQDIRATLENSTEFGFHEPGLILKRLYTCSQDNMSLLYCKILVGFVGSLFLMALFYLPCSCQVGWSFEDGALQQQVLRLRSALRAPPPLRLRSARLRFFLAGPPGG